MVDRREFRDSHSTWTIETSSNPDEPPLRMLRMGQGLENMDRAFDQAFWQALGSSAISEAACELVELYLTARGRAHELRLQRSVGGLKRRRRPRRTEDLFLGVPAHFIGLDDLMRTKEAAGRPQDRRDLRRLRKSVG